MPASHCIYRKANSSHTTVTLSSTCSYMREPSWHISFSSAAAAMALKHCRSGSAHLKGSPSSLPLTMSWFPPLQPVVIPKRKNVKFLLSSQRLLSPLALPLSISLPFDIFPIPIDLPLLLAIFFLFSHRRHNCQFANSKIVPQLQFQGLSALPNYIS